MRLAFATSLATFVTLASAHFRLGYPPPRGPFVASKEPTYCDGYVTTTDNRTLFPLDGGFITVHSGHPAWTFGVQIANVSNPTSFDNFTTAKPFFPSSGVGDYCFPIDLSSAGVSGLANGTNVTLQFTYDGGDGSLYQCADVTLISNYQVPANITCSNVTSTSTSSSGPSGTAPPTQTGAASQLVNNAHAAAVIGIAGLVLLSF